MDPTRFEPNPSEGVDRTALIGGAPVTLVVAPPGFGKSTLARQWVRRHGGKLLEVGWRHRLPHRLLDEVEPLEGRELGLDDHLALAIDGLRGSSLVLDDVHRARDAPGLGPVIERLVEAAGPFRLILLGREEPELPELARADACRHLQRLGPADLALSPLETADLVRSLRGAPIAEGAARRIWERTGGWAALVVLLATRAEDPDAPASAPDALFDYLIGVVLSSLSREARLSLEIVASSPPIRAEGACRLAGCGFDVAAQLRRSGLLREAEDGTVRIHSLVRAAVLSRLATTPPPVERAERLLAVQEDGAALQTLAEAGLHDSIAALLERWRIDEPDRFVANRDSLSALPAQTLAQYPELARRAVLDRLRRSDTAGAEPLLTEAEAEAARRGDAVLADQLALDRTLVPRLRGDWAATREALAAVEGRMARASAAVRLRYLNFLAVALLHEEGSLKRAGSVLDAIVADATAAGVEPTR